MQKFIKRLKSYIHWQQFSRLSFRILVLNYSRYPLYYRKLDLPFIKFSYDNYVNILNIHKELMFLKHLLRHGELGVSFFSITRQSHEYVKSRSRHPSSSLNYSGSCTNRTVPRLRHCFVFARQVMNPRANAFTLVLQTLRDHGSR